MKKLSHKSFKIVARRYVLFFANPQMGVQDFIKKILPKWMGDFSQDPIILPTAESFPSGMPRVILKDDAGNSIQLSNERLDIILIHNEDELGHFKSMTQRAEKYFEEFFEKVNWDISRVASVITRKHPIKHAGKVLAKHFCNKKYVSKDGALNRPMSFNIDSHKTFQMKAFSVNSWMRNHAAPQTDSDLGEISCTQDINTVLGEPKPLTFAKVKAFLKESTIESNKILNLYYPE
ncbi:MAG: hypothetical protein KAS17_08625 [Victivallaceae bacterium]|nr:hypothetical protein [Victivallaceae bacterium]